MTTARPIGLVPGTRDWLPDDFARLGALEAQLLDGFARAGYARLRVPILESTELHERTGGARLVNRLFRLAESHRGRLSLRPELTASIVRAYSEVDPPPPLPWRVSYAGSVFRGQTEGYREFTQVGVELLGAPRPAADGEVIRLADRAAADAGLQDVTIRIGHVGLVLELLEHSGLPERVQATLIERLCDAATADGREPDPDRVVSTLEDWLGRLMDYSRTADSPAPSAGGAPPIGRRTRQQIQERLESKRRLGESLSQALRGFRHRVHELADLSGPAAEVLERLGRDFANDAPRSVQALGDLMSTLRDFGIEPERVRLDLGFGRGIGFYSQMVFELETAAKGRPIAVCGGGRYDGLAQELGSGHDARGVGFAFGLERLLEALEAQGHAPTRPEPSGLLILTDSPEALPRAVALAERLRAEGATAILETDRDPAHAATSAMRLGLMALVVVSDRLRVRELHGDGHDLEVTPEQLTRIAREGGRR